MIKARFLNTVQELVRLIRSGVTPQNRAPQAAEPTANKAAQWQPAPQFLRGHFSHAEGSRDYRLYIPSDYERSDQALALLVMLHGCTQDAEDFAVGTQMNQWAERYRVLVLYPSQARSANLKRCWNWYKPKNQQANRGEPAMLAGLTQTVMKSYRVDSERVYIAGLSAGGAMAAIMGATYPELYAAIGVHSGLAAGSASHIIAALMAMRQGSRQLQTRSELPRFVPTIIFQGDQDRIVAASNAEQLLAQAKQSLEASKVPLKIEQQIVRPPSGHAYTRIQIKDLRGQTQIDYWLVHGAGHAWSGGNIKGSYTDPEAPNASQEMLRFFLEHPLTLKAQG